MSHPWKSSGSKRTIWWYYNPSDQVIEYLTDMREAIRHGVLKAEELGRINGKIPSSIDLRKAIKSWFDSQYDYARHHVNPVCRSSVAILRSFRKNGKGKRYPEVKKLSMRIDSELVKIENHALRITIRPGEYEFIPMKMRNRKWHDYGNYRISEVLITDSVVSVSFIIPENKSVGEDLTGMDCTVYLNSGQIVKRIMREIPPSHLLFFLSSSLPSLRFLPSRSLPP